MKRIAVVVTAALISLSLSGIAFAVEEANPVPEKKEAASEAKPEKKIKKVKKSKKSEEGKSGVDKEGAAKPIKKKREAQGC